MPAASNPRPHPSRPPLSLVAERLEATVHELGWGRPPLLVGLGVESDGPREPAPLPKVEAATDDPVADLLGYVVPADCSGLAVVAEGTGRRLVDGRRDGRIRARRPRRTGWPTSSTAPGGPAAPSGRAAPTVTVVDDDDGAARGPTGRLVDVCRRAMGLPTATAARGHGPVVVAELARPPAGSGPRWFGTADLGRRRPDSIRP